MIEDLEIEPTEKDQLSWRFDAKSGEHLESAYLDIFGRLGAWAFEQLDDVLLDTPAQAATRATKIYRQLLTDPSPDDQATVDRVRDFMNSLAELMGAANPSPDPILPAQALWRDAL